MQRLYVHAIFVIVFVCPTAFSQIWFVKNVSNVSIDDCYVSFGDNCGIAYCFPERYIEPEKLAEWNDNAFYYILYPVDTFDSENDADGGSQAHQAPTRVYDPGGRTALPYSNGAASFIPIKICLYMRRLHHCRNHTVPTGHSSCSNPHH